MADRIYSSDAWTGPPDLMSAPYRAPFTYPAGGPSATTDTAFLSRQAVLASRAAIARPPLLGWAALLLVSQVTLWIGSNILDLAAGDWRLPERSNWLFLWAFMAALIGIWQVKSRTVRLIALRRTMLALLLLGTVGLASANVYLGLRSKAAAIATPPERVFVWFSSRGHGVFSTTMANFQRADGSFVDGRPAAAPLDYGRFCALVQRLDGPFGYSWIRVRQWSRGPSGQLAWPIRREECFSDIPLSTLPR